MMAIYSLLWKIYTLTVLRCFSRQRLKGMWKPCRRYLNLSSLTESTREVLFVEVTLNPMAVGYFSASRLTMTTNGSSVCANIASELLLSLQLRGFKSEILIKFTHRNSPLAKVGRFFYFCNAFPSQRCGLKFFHRIFVRIFSSLPACACRAVLM